MQSDAALTVDPMLQEEKTQEPGAMDNVPAQAPPGRRFVDGKVFLPPRWVTPPHNDPDSGSLERWRTGDMEISNNFSDTQFVGVNPRPSLEPIEATPRPLGDEFPPRPNSAVEYTNVSPPLSDLEEMGASSPLIDVPSSSHEVPPSPPRDALLPHRSNMKVAHPLVPRCTREVSRIRLATEDHDVHHAGDFAQLLSVGDAYIACLLEPTDLQYMPQFTLQLLSPRRPLPQGPKPKPPRRNWHGPDKVKRFHKQCRETWGTSKGHLSPRGDMTSVFNKDLSMYLILNIIPVKTTVNAGNNLAIERGICRLVDKEGKAVVIYSGHLGVQERINTYGIVPEFIYKIVLSSDKYEPIACILICNGPERTIRGKLPLGVEVPWWLNKVKKDPEHGITRVVELHDFYEWCTVNFPNAVTPEICMENTASLIGKLIKIGTGAVTRARPLSLQLLADESSANICDDSRTPPAS
ncbi:Nuclease EXOG, mitochondrial [Frankliniella fusca]|uniref:Nuclease EXOG, mitochondrial n=1 Tax=Frankliniella fusca TaxID=407009 RepID=A0AAE1LR94_9NEOP|nr:Nuclease EXOG, mitochondrial [Frankliniella fusca]